MNSNNYFVPIFTMFFIVIFIKFYHVYKIIFFAKNTNPLRKLSYFLVALFLGNYNNFISKNPFLFITALLKLSYQVKRIFIRFSLLISSVSVRRRVRNDSNILEDISFMLFFKSFILSTPNSYNCLNISVICVNK